MPRTGAAFRRSGIGALTPNSVQDIGDDAVAASAGEAESVFTCDVDLLGESLAQEAARAKEARAASCARDSPRRSTSHVKTLSASPALAATASSPMSCTEFGVRAPIPERRNAAPVR